MIERQVKAWADFPEWKKITDDDIKEILEYKVKIFSFFIFKVLPQLR